MPVRALLSTLFTYDNTSYVLGNVVVVLEKLRSANVPCYEVSRLAGPGPRSEQTVLSSASTHRAARPSAS